MSYNATIPITPPLDEETKSLADFIHAAESPLSELLRRQFRFVALSVIAAVGVFVCVYALLIFLARTPVNVDLLRQLEESNKNLSELTIALLREPGAAAGRALEAAVAQADAHRRAVAELRENQQAPSQDLQSIVQIIGGAVVLTLLGILGLQRLQNIDAEINNLRESIHSQIQARMQDIEKVLSASIDDEVAKQFGNAHQELEKLWNRQQNLSEQFRREKEELLAEAANSIQVVTTETKRFQSLLETYPWLKSKEELEQVRRLEKLASVEQAHKLAVLFNLSKDAISAREALRKIVIHRLPGEPDDYHNAHTEAMRMEDVGLALEIVEVGLERFPDHYELVPDKVRALKSVGRAHEALQIIEQWIRSKPDEFTRSWRGAVFYADLIDAVEMTDETRTKLEEALKLAVKKLPFEVKPATILAKFYLRTGRESDAIKVLEEALTRTPLSQQLNYLLGEIYLRKGDVRKALHYLEKAFAVDYEEQYQHGINQLAVRATLAQAYEADGQLEKAALFYRSIVHDSEDEGGTIVTYARNRLKAISLMQGQLPQAEEARIALRETELRKLLGEALQTDAQGENSRP